MKKRLKEKNVKGVKVHSAGLMADDGEPMSAFSRQALHFLEIHNVRFKSKQFSVDMIKGKTLIICMTNSHKQALKGVKHVYSASDIVGEDIIDPYGQSLGVYIKTAKQINLLVEEIMKLINSDKGENK